MPQIVSVNPFRCRMWSLHDRLEHLIQEETCRTEIASFIKHGQVIAVLGRPVHDDPECDIELIFGARRLFVARHLNVPLVVELREITDREAIVAVDIENRQRTDVSPYERGLFFARCLRAGHYKSQEELAADLKISQSQVSRLLKLARLPSVIVNAFENPLEIREGWGPGLIEILEDVETRKRTIALARTFVDMSPRPPAMDVYQQLITASVTGRKIRAKNHDEVVTDADGSPLFRIRRQAKSIALLLPIEKISSDTLDAVRDAVRDVLKGDRHPAPHVEITEHYPSRRTSLIPSSGVGAFNTFRPNDFAEDYQDPGAVGGRDS
jgi:ParB family transcriptional regulator, chromosome partitioning protein